MGTDNQPEDVVLVLSRSRGSAQSVGGALPTEVTGPCLGCVCRVGAHLILFATRSTRTVTASMLFTSTGWPAGPWHQGAPSVEILTIGRDLATVNSEFKVRGHDRNGRQSQTWVRVPEHGWKAVGAQVSTVSEKSFW